MDQKNTNKEIIITELGWQRWLTLAKRITQTAQADYISRVYTKIMYKNYQYIKLPVFMILKTTVLINI